ncbi:MAG: DNA/RNA non-specific endonuclease [Acidobacteria bacterium]|nr:DNA/RNA non-specific endonuclease [Acidobacteriota bacterium]
MTTDHLGSPRVVTDEDGRVTSRRDYTAFGEESVTPERAAGLGYAGPSGTRKGYTGYEKDTESGLDFAQARYYNPTHGRFTSVDPLTASATIRNPQTFNRYTYVLNSPYKFTDPLGLIPETTGACGNRCRNSDGGGGGGAFDAAVSGGWDSGYRSGVEGSILAEAERWARYYEARPWLSAMRSPNYVPSFASLGSRQRANTTANPTESSEPLPATPCAVLACGEVTSFSRIITRNTIGVLGRSVSVQNIISDITTATIVQSPVPTGESSDGTLPRFLGHPNKDLVIGRKFGGDQAGHIIGASLGGKLMNGDNLFSQNARVNNSQYRTMENEVRRTLKANPGWTATITVSLHYPRSGPRRFRPSGGTFSVLYSDANRVPVFGFSRPFPN